MGGPKWSIHPGDKPALITELLHTHSTPSTGDCTLLSGFMHACHKAERIRITVRIADIQLLSDEQR